MAYASVADMVARFGDLEVIELTDRSHSGQIDEAEKELAGMLGDLTGNARDMAGLEELKALLGGE